MAKEMRKKIRKKANKQQAEQKQLRLCAKAHIQTLVCVNINI